MGVIYRASLRTTRMNAVVTDIGTSGKLVIGTSALSGATGVLATCALSSTAGTVSGDRLTFSAITDGTGATGGGTAAKAEIRKSDDTTIISGLTVGVGGSYNVNISSVTIGEGATVSVSSAYIDHNSTGA